MATLEHTATKLKSHDNLILNLADTTQGAHQVPFAHRLCPLMQFGQHPVILVSGIKKQYQMFFQNHPNWSACADVFDKTHPQARI